MWGDRPIIRILLRMPQRQLDLELTSAFGQVAKPDPATVMLRDALGGGGIASLRFDPQGKAYAQQLLDMPLHVPSAWLAHPSIAEVPEVEAAREVLPDTRA